MLLVISCRTTEVQTKTVYVVPDVEWPEFPDVSSARYDDITDEVIVSGDWWMYLAEFKRDFDRIKYVFTRLGDQADE